MIRRSFFKYLGALASLPILSSLTEKVFGQNQDNSPAKPTPITFGDLKELDLFTIGNEKTLYRKEHNTSICYPVWYDSHIPPYRHDENSIVIYTNNDVKFVRHYGYSQPFCGTKLYFTDETIINPYYPF